MLITSSNMLTIKPPLYHICLLAWSEFTRSSDVRDGWGGYLSCLSLKAKLFLLTWEMQLFQSVVMANGNRIMVKM